MEKEKQREIRKQEQMDWDTEDEDQETLKEILDYQLDAEIRKTKQDIRDFPGLQGIPPTIL